MKGHGAIICTEGIGTGSVSKELHSAMLTALERSLKKLGLRVYLTSDRAQVVLSAEKNSAKTIIFLTIEAMAAAESVAKQNPDLTVILLNGGGPCQIDEALPNLKILEKASDRVVFELAKIIGKA